MSDPVVRVAILRCEAARFRRMRPLMTDAEPLGALA